MNRLLIVLAALILLSACASAPPSPNFRIEKGAKVGVFVDITTYLHHYHGSSVLFGGINKLYDLDPGLNGYVKDSLTKALERDGSYEVVDLNDLGFSRFELAFLITLSDDAWRVPPSHTKVYKKLKDELGLKAVVVVNERLVNAATLCYGLVCSPLYAMRQGLFTQGNMLVGDIYTSVAAYLTEIFVLDPPVNLSRVPNGIEVWKGRYTRMENVPKSPDIKNISAETWTYTIKVIKAYVDRLYTVTRKLLDGQPVENSKPFTF
jgi:hypothetical protein